MDLPFETTKVRYFFIPTKFFDRSDLLDKSDRLERAEGNGEIQKRGSRIFDGKKM